MVRSLSCFRIVTCGDGPAAAADQDELAPTESKRSTDRRGWSFRKRSARHKVIINNVNLDTPSSGQKESLEVDIVTPDCNVAEKLSLIESTGDKPRLSIVKADVIGYGENKSEDVSAVVPTQDTAMDFLDENEFLKLQSLVKIQAAIRGHLVRRQAVGTILCVQAIVKMQILFRARKAHLALKRPSADETENLKNKNDTYSTEEHENEALTGGYKVASSAFNNLQKISFAHKLLESSPKGRHLYLKCDPSVPNPAWNWMERWTSVASTRLAESRETEFKMHQDENITLKESVPCGKEDITSDVDESDAKSIAKELPASVGNDESCLTGESVTSSSQEAVADSSSFKDDLGKPEVEKTSCAIMEETQTTIESSGNQLLLLDSNNQSEVNSSCRVPEVDVVQPRKDAVETAAPELPKVEEKRLAAGPRKASNPAFITAQVKFKELSLSSKSVASNLSSGISPTGADTLSIRKKQSQDKNNRLIHVGGLEFDSEPSNSFTAILETASSTTECSADEKVIDEGANMVPFAHDVEMSVKDVASIPVQVQPSDTLIKECDDEEKVVNEGIAIATVAVVAEMEVKDVNILPVQAENPGHAKVISGGSEGDTKYPDVEENKTEMTESDLNTELETENNHERHDVSPEGSPRSHVVIHETPSSNVATQSKKRKTINGSSQKKSYSAGKLSPLSKNAPRKSFEKLTKDEKPGKSHHSFSPATPDRVDQDLSNGKSVPSYMQATESAKAKALATTYSPKSSPDVHERILPANKRPSVPGVNGNKQRSPKLLRSPSKVVNGTPPQDKTSRI